MHVNQPFRNRLHIAIKQGKLCDSLIKMNSGHLSAHVRLQNVIDAKAMLESGIPFPILDSMFVVQNQKKLNVQLVPSEISMDLNGRKMRCYYQTQILYL